MLRSARSCQVRRRLKLPRIHPWPTALITRRSLTTGTITAGSRHLSDREPGNGWIILTPLICGNRPTSPAWDATSFTAARNGRSVDAFATTASIVFKKADRYGSSTRRSASRLSGLRQETSKPITVRTSSQSRGQLLHSATATIILFSANTGTGGGTFVTVRGNSRHTPPVPKVPPPRMPLSQLFPSLINPYNVLRLHTSTIVFRAKS